jgi:hypothetical protein
LRASSMNDLLAALAEQIELRPYQVDAIVVPFFPEGHDALRRQYRRHLRCSQIGREPFLNRNRGSPLPPRWGASLAAGEDGHQGKAYIRGAALAVDAPPLPPPPPLVGHDVAAEGARSLRRQRSGGSNPFGRANVFNHFLS